MMKKNLLLIIVCSFFALCALNAQDSQQEQTNTTEQVKEGLFTTTGKALKNYVLLPGAGILTCEVLNILYAIPAVLLNLDNAIYNSQIIGHGLATIGALVLRSKKKNNDNLRYFLNGFILSSSLSTLTRLAKKLRYDIAINEINKSRHSMSAFDIYDTTKFKK